MDAFREELLSQKKKELDLIMSQFAAGTWSRDKVVDTIIRSVTRRKGAASVEDSTIYKVAKWLRDHRDSKTGKIQNVKNKTNLYDRISSDMKVPKFTVMHCLKTNPFNLPEELQHKDRLPRTVVPKETLPRPEITTNSLSSEFDAMRNIVKELDKLDALPVQKRVIKWIGEKYGVVLD